ncbi:MAG: hypothetical protein FWD64_08025 [Acidobacteriaceae bacterium]|nr:hypothetical protein [Acidobacteriaceae bacterium]
MLAKIALRIKPKGLAKPRSKNRPLSLMPSPEDFRQNATEDGIADVLFIPLPTGSACPETF